MVKREKGKGERSYPNLFLFIVDIYIVKKKETLRKKRTQFEYGTT